MSLQDGQVDDDDRHDTEDYVRPGNAGDICRSGILSRVVVPVPASAILTSAVIVLWCSWMLA